MDDVKPSEKYLEDSRRNDNNGDHHRRRERSSRTVDRERNGNDDHRDDRQSKRGDRDRDRNRDHRDREEDCVDRDVRRREDRRKEKDWERGKEKEKLRGKEEREEEGAREHERIRRRDREREDRERERERDRTRTRQKRRELEREEVDYDYERKRRRREDEYNDRERDRSGRHREGSEDNRRSGRAEEKVEDEEERKKKKLEEEQLRLDDEAEKRRRRVQEWQETKRKKEEDEHVEVQKSGKNWTLEGDSDDDEVAIRDMDADGEVAIRDMDADGDRLKARVENGEATDVEILNGEADVNLTEEIDPLDAFMNSMVLPEAEKLESAVVVVETEQKNVVGNDIRGRKGVVGNGIRGRKGVKNSMGRIIQGEDSDSDYEEPENEDVAMEDENDDEFMKRVKKTKVEKLSIVDHSKIQYPPFRKNFYIESKEMSRMSGEEVCAYRSALELKIHGKDVPKPIKTWSQTGLTSKILDTIKKLNFYRPMAIQAQALPIIMSGRDCIGVAKTGSGKTLAFVLPMLRHIKDQPPVVPSDGPIGLIMAPTRELVQQIYNDVKKFAKPLGLNCVPVYGGSGIAQQISELKRGAEIVVCTPGRMIDVLCTSGGKITNLRRVTYLVMDEADRMFDMGFEPQITRIVQNIRPDRQTVLFSATFPRQVEILARKVLNRPVEVQVGGRSVVNKDITQLVEVRPENDRFLRLLEILGEWYEKGKILVFVHSQDRCDSLFKDLLKHGYPCLSLHGAKDQTDRESTVFDFKSNVCNLLIATSIAARGLDVKELELVVNFDVPNHYEDYVHRVGRTGRAGRKGCAITFISQEGERYAPDLVKALELSEQAVPGDLKALADGFMAKVNQGTEQAHGTGYGGSGFKFNEEEDEARKAAKKAQAREYGFEEDKSDSDSEDEGVRKAGGDLSQVAAVAALAAAKLTINNAGPFQATAPSPLSAAIPAGNLPAAGATPVSALPGEATARATAIATAYLAKLQAESMPEHYEAELEINDFPQNARWKVTHKETLGPISDWTGAAITIRGQYLPSGKTPGPGEHKLYLYIEGPTDSSVKKAKAELKRVLEDYTARFLNLPGTGQPGKYSVI